jgi:hypothetical protein
MLHIIFQLLWRIKQWCTTEFLLSMAHVARCATQTMWGPRGVRYCTWVKTILWRMCQHAPQKDGLLWRTLAYAPQNSVWGPRPDSSRPHFCGAYVNMGHRSSSLCGACRHMRHKIFCFFCSPCKSTPLQWISFLVM